MMNLTPVTPQVSGAIDVSLLSRDERLNILVSRPDRLGDVILSLPVFEAIKSNYPTAHLTVLVTPLVAPLLRGLPYIDDVLIYDATTHHSGLRGLFRLVAQMRRRKFRILVALQSNRKVAWAGFWARIRYRVGPLSKLHSYLLYNRGMRQRRSLVEMHETDYNLALLRKIGIRAASRRWEPQVTVRPDAQIRAENWLRAQNQGIWPLQRSLVVFHPGMGGSALNWPEAHYLALIRALQREGHQVLITAGVGENSLLQRFQQELADLGNSVWYYGGSAAGPIDDLAALFSYAALVVAPSTGPLHLATAVRRRVITFYSPIRVQSALRWGPYLKDESRASILHPQNYCGQDFKCLGTLCNYYPCMKSITVVQALEECRLQLERRQVELKAEAEGSL